MLFGPGPPDVVPIICSSATATVIARTGPAVTDRSKARPTCCPSEPISTVAPAFLHQTANRSRCQKAAEQTTKHVASVQRRAEAVSVLTANRPAIKHPAVAATSRQPSNSALPQRLQSEAISMAVSSPTTSQPAGPQASS